MDDLKPTTMVFIGLDHENRESVCLALRQSSVVEMNGELVAGVAFSKKNAIELAELLVVMSREID